MTNQEDNSKKLIEENAKKLKLDFETLSEVRKKLKEANLLSPPKELLKYISAATMDADNLVNTYTQDQLLEMQEAAELWEQLQWENGKTIVECVELVLKDEFKQEYYGDFNKCQELLFRSIIPKIRKAF